MSTHRVLLACVGEDTPPFHARIEDLVASARALGGALADAPVVVSTVGSADPAFERRLEALDAEVRVVERVLDDGAPHANKLRMLELASRGDFDILLAVDCDVAVAADPTPLVSSDAVAVVPADTDPLSERQWRRLLAGLDLDLRERTVNASTTGRPMYPYFNSGVVAVPRELCADLLGSWREALERLERLWRRQPAVIPRAKRFFADQYALMAALQRVPWLQASRELNFPTHVELEENTVSGLRPALLHYHGALDSLGFLLMPRSAVAAEAADRVNRERALRRGLSYPGLRRPAMRPATARILARGTMAAKAVGRPLLRR